MKLGAFSVSLAVKDLEASKAFYEKLGFTAMGGGESWQIMKNEQIVLGLFQGMFDDNILTFNPGWTQGATPVDGAFDDVREIQAALKAAGVDLDSEVDAANENGPGSFLVKDPDGNVIMFDQHV